MTKHMYVLRISKESGRARVWVLKGWMHWSGVGAPKGRMKDYVVTVTFEH